MKNWLFSFIAPFFTKQIQIIKETSMREGYRNRIDFVEKENRQIEISQLNEMLGKKVICFSNEWENPVIGIVKEITTITQANQPVPVILDYLTMKEGISLTEVYPYTEQRFEAILKLNPFERCALIYTNFYNDEEFEKPKIGTINTKEEIIKILKHNGFYEQ